MKRRVLLLVAALVLLPAFSWRCAAPKKFRIAVSLPPANNAWQAKMLDSVNAEVAKDTTNFDITVKNAVDDADQLNQMTTFKGGGYDMILRLPGNGTLMTPICQEIYKSGTKLLIIDRAIEGDQYTTFYGGDNAQCGRNAAKYIGDRLKGKGQIAILRSYVGIPIDLQRYNGFMEVLKKSYPGIKVVVEGDGEFNQEAGLKAMSNILPAYPQIDAVFSQDDESAVGALTADQEREAHRHPVRHRHGRLQFRLRPDDRRRTPCSAPRCRTFPPWADARWQWPSRCSRARPSRRINIEPTVVVTQDNVAKYVTEGY